MLSRSPRVVLVVLLALISGLATARALRPRPVSGQAPADGYLFCFWNVENLFDDHLDHREQKGDREFDTWFARDPQALHQKLDHLSQALIDLNDGKGPDILAVAEVESVRAAELLREALNRRIADPAFSYSSVLMKNLDAGRHIA